MLIDKFHKYIKENSLLEPEDKVLLAVSGGVDSMVMLNLFVESGYHIAVAHCNFMLRGQESEEDEQLIEQSAQALGVPHYNMRFQTQDEVDRSGDSVQMVARRLRYEWFDSLCNEHGYNVVAIAHHADDSVETFFINLLRGTGLRGLTGISVTNGKIIRPLLFASRKDILDYAHHKKIQFREDSSNRSTKYLRNKVRLGLIPRIKEINPKFTEMMSRNVQRLTEAQMFISHGIEKIAKDTITIKDGMHIIDISTIDPAFPLNFVIYELLLKYGFRGDVNDSLCKAIHMNNSGKRFYSKEYVAYVDRGNIIISDIPDNDSCEVEIRKDSQKIYCGNSILFIEHTDIDNIESEIQPEHIALIDAKNLMFPLTVRRWKEGDTFIPLGMSGRKKLSDFLIDAKVSMAEKQRQFVVCNGEDIVWVVGRRIDDRYRITTKTEEILKIIREPL